MQAIKTTQPHNRKKHCQQQQRFLFYQLYFELNQYFAAEINFPFA